MDTPAAAPFVAPGVAGGLVLLGVALAPGLRLARRLPSLRRATPDRAVWHRPGLPLGPALGSVLTACHLPVALAG